MSIGRRGFLKGLAVGTLAAGSAAGTALAAGGISRFTGHPGRKGLLHDSTLCVGCRSCELACTQANGQPPPEPALGDARVFDVRRGVSDRLYTVVNRYRGAEAGRPAVFRKHQCMHCNEPCCASVCFVGAFTKTREGPVYYDASLCVGCRYCVFACPYYALAYEYDRPLTPRVVRCTMCYDHATGRADPRCAHACPTGAILFGDRAELLQVARDRMARSPGRYQPEIFGEWDLAGTSWLTLVGLPPAQVGLLADLSHQPLPDLTTSFLTLAPLVAAIFPGLLAGFYAFTKRKERLHEDELKALVAAARAEARAELDRRLHDAASEAARDTEIAVARAVREALRTLGTPAGKEASK
jgi:Fe-S-cluster-containing dehydrogenase component